MKHLIQRKAPLLISFLALACGLLAQAPGSSTKEILRQAKHSYYNLKNEGLSGFHCRVLPDWDAVYEGQKIDAPNESFRALLKNVHFDVKVGPEGASTVSRQSDTAPVNEQIADRLRTVSNGVELMLTGVLQTWSQFMFGILVFGSDEVDYQLENVGQEYRLTQTEGPNSVVTMMTREYVVTERKIDVPQMRIIYRPQFSRTEKGYILSSYEADVKTSPSAIQQIDTRLAVKFDYVKTHGFELPAMFKVTLARSTGEIPLSFSDCKVNEP